MNFLVILATIITEFFIYAAVIRKNFLKLLLYSVLINSFTNPLANLAFNFGVNLFVIETSVFVAEIFLIRYIICTKFQKAVLISLAANLLSFILGFLFLSKILY